MTKWTDEMNILNCNFEIVLKTKDITNGVLQEHVKGVIRKARCSGASIREESFPQNLYYLSSPSCL